MTKAEAEKIKTGQKILIEAIFDRIDEDGDAAIEYTNSVSDGERGFFDPKHIVGVASETQLNKPKYDPCRLYKKGDRVKPRAGRDVYACEWEDAVFHKLTGVYELEADEKEGHVTIFDNETGTECYVSVFAIELITPVEELEPYQVGKGIDDKILYKNKEIYAEFEDEKEAERVCNLLNKQYRKEQHK